MRPRRIIAATLGVLVVTIVVARRPHHTTATQTDPHGTWGLLDRKLTPLDVEYQPSS